jgi:ADP-ribose pyrophosphatase YjhB (NUDIX family)
MSIRVSVSAIIIRNQEILLIEFDDANGIHFNLPGGGVKEGEALADALVRECTEEACARVRPGRLLFLWEYIPDSARPRYGAKQKLCAVFACALESDCEPRLPDSPDAHQIGIRWVPLDSLPHMPLVPHIGQRIVETLATGDGPDINVLRI